MLYSDGLVERRDLPLQAGLDELLAALERAGNDRRTRLCEAVTDELLGTTGGDDSVCVLALHLAR